MFTLFLKYTLSLSTIGRVFESDEDFALLIIYKE